MLKGMAVDPNIPKMLEFKGNQVKVGLDIKSAHGRATHAHTFGWHSWQGTNLRKQNQLQYLVLCD